MTTADEEATPEKLEAAARALSYNNTPQEGLAKWLLLQAADVIRRHGKPQSKYEFDWQRKVWIRRVPDY